MTLLLLLLLVFSIVILILILLGFVLQVDKSRYPILLAPSHTLDERRECTSLNLEFLDTMNVLLEETVSLGGFKEVLCLLLGVELERVPE